MSLITDAQSSLSDLRNELEKQDAAATIHLTLFSSRGPKDKRVRRLMVNSELADAIRDLCVGNVANLDSKATDEDVLSEYDFDAMAQGSIGVASASTMPSIMDWVNQIPGADWDIIYKNDEKYLSQISHYAITITLDDGRTASLLRGRRGIDISLAQKGAIIAYFSSDDEQLHQITDIVVRLDGKVDFLFWDDTVYIENMAAFESITNIREITAHKAVEALEKVAAQITFPQRDQFLEAIKNKTRLTKKLAAAVMHGQFDDLDGARLVDLIEKKGSEKVISKKGGGYEIDIDPNSNSSVTELVHLLTDYYVEASGSGRRYRALVKRPNWV